MLEVNPFERMNWPAHGCSEDLNAYWVVFKQEMWWFQIRTQVIAEYVPSLLECLSMQAGFQVQHRRVERAGRTSDRRLERACGLGATQASARIERRPFGPSR